MYNKLKEQADEKYDDYFLKTYLSSNKIIDEKAEEAIAKAMSRGEKSWVLFYKKNPNIKYRYLFKEYYEPPYDKPILLRLQYKFPEPEFKCVAKHVHTELFHYYIVKVKWGNKQQCQLF